jgi:hypothetical protein
VAARTSLRFCRDVEVSTQDEETVDMAERAGMDNGREIGKRASVSCLLCRFEHRYPVCDIAGANMSNSTNPTTTNIHGPTANRLRAPCPLTLFDLILNKTILLQHMSCTSRRCGVFIAVICSVCPNQKVPNGIMSKLFGGWRNTLFFF